MSIPKLQLSNLVNSNHVNLMEFTVKAIEKFPYIAETFPKPVQFIKASYDRENDAYLKRNRSYLTKQVQAANNVRIVRFREVNNILKGAELCTDPVKAEAAEFLLSVIKDYGGASKIIASRVDSISGILTNLVEDFQHRFADKTAAAGLTGCVEELREANEAYKTLRGDRTLEVSQQEKEEMARARAESDTNWRGLVDMVNWRYYYEQDALLLPFMRYMTTEVEWYRTILGQKPATGEDEASDEEPEDDETGDGETGGNDTIQPSDPAVGGNENEFVPTLPPALDIEGEQIGGEMARGDKNF